MEATSKLKSSEGEKTESENIDLERDRQKMIVIDMFLSLIPYHKRVAHYFLTCLSTTRDAFQAHNYFFLFFFFMVKHTKKFNFYSLRFKMSVILGHILRNAMIKRKRMIILPNYPY